MVTKQQASLATKTTGKKLMLSSREQSSTKREREEKQEKVVSCTIHNHADVIDTYYLIRVRVYVRSVCHSTPHENFQKKRRHIIAEMSLFFVLCCAVLCGGVCFVLLCSHSLFVLLAAAATLRLRQNRIWRSGRRSTTPPYQEHTELVVQIVSVLPLELAV
jgi:hypothetical protein